jgi:hypothetical protein
MLPELTFFHCYYGCLTWQVRALEKFYLTLSNDQDRACYGLKDVTLANEQLAIDELLVTDTLFKAADISTRQKYVALVDSVRENGGKVHVFSCLHVSGVQLNLYTGIAATLRHPMPELDEISDDNFEPLIHNTTPATENAATEAVNTGSVSGVNDDLFDMDANDFSIFSF